MLIVKVRRGESVQIGTGVSFYFDEAARPVIDAPLDVPVALSPDAALIGGSMHGDILVRLLGGFRVSIHAPPTIEIMRSDAIRQTR